MCAHYTRTKTDHFRSKPHILYISKHFKDCRRKTACPEGIQNPHFPYISSISKTFVATLLVQGNTLVSLHHPGRTTNEKPQNQGFDARKAQNPIKPSFLIFGPPDFSIKHNVFGAGASQNINKTKAFEARPKSHQIAPKGPWDEIDAKSYVQGYVRAMSGTCSGGVTELRNCLSRPPGRSSNKEVDGFQYCVAPSIEN